MSGGAKGVDSWAESAAKFRDLDTLICLPDWEKYGKAAGFQRNSLIVDNSDVVIAFWNGNSGGTMDTVRKAQKAGKKVHLITTFEEAKDLAEEFKLLW